MNAETTLVDFDALQAVRAAAKASHLPVFNALELGKTQFPPIKFVVPGFLPEGCTILAGRPKLGKSWLALDMALAVARGTTCLGVDCEQGNVLYLAMEDNRRRLQSRLHKLAPARELDPWPSALDLATEWKRHDAGGLDDIRSWAASRVNPRLVIVDVLAMFRGARGMSENQYEADYGAVKGLQELASDLGIAAVIIHHVRKGMGDADPFERVSGTMGLTGAADTTIILDREAAGCTLYCRGRDIQEYERAVAFDKFDCRWTVQGEVSDVRRTDERTAILDVLLAADDILTVSDIVTATAMNRNACDQLLYKMSKDGQINKAKRGHYFHADRADLTPSTPDKIGKKIRIGA
jgi:hypothetical protein